MTALRCKNRLLDLSRPVVMGILNVTPDSFFDGGKFTEESAVLRQAEKMLREGAAILDIGGASSRPGAAEVSEAEEMQRVLPAIEAILKKFPETILSVDTWRASVARAAVGAGASIWNDISALAPPPAPPKGGRSLRPQTGESQRAKTPPPLWGGWGGQPTF